MRVWPSTGGAVAVVSVDLSQPRLRICAGTSGERRRPGRGAPALHEHQGLPGRPDGTTGRPHATHRHRAAFQVGGRRRRQAGRQSDTPHCSLIRRRSQGGAPARGTADSRGAGLCGRAAAAPDMDRMCELSGQPPARRRPACGVRASDAA